jgi:hypothetical protein
MPYQKCAKRKAQLRIDPSKNIKPMELKILQINLDRTRAAHDLFAAEVEMSNIDIAIVAEPNKKIAETANWDVDRKGDCAIICLNKKCSPEIVTRGNGYIAVRLQKLTIYSCYISPNCNLPEYERYMDELFDSVSRQQGDILVAGDFNAASRAWGSKRTNRRGSYMMELISKLDLVIANNGDAPTFERGTRQSTPDVTMTCSRIAGLISEWRVLEEETLSGHKYITYRLYDNKQQPTAPECARWNTKKIDKQKFEEAMKRESFSSPEELVAATNRACHMGMPKKKRIKRKPAYWWNEEIAKARKECVKLRRIYTRNRGTHNQDNDSNMLKIAYKTAKGDLKKLIIKSKQTHWENICEEINSDVWGKGYKIATKRFKFSTPAALPMEKIKEISKVLFPTHEEFPRLIKETEEVPEVTVAEIKRAVKRLKLKKAPGPDMIPPEAVRMAVEAVPEKICELMGAILRSGEYPTVWKIARLMLLKKSNKPPTDPSGYRPLCLLDCYGKLLERIILNRIESMLPEHGNLAEQQYGFRAGRSTLGAVERAIKFAERAKQGTHRTREICALVALDVRNAFNSASWQLILEEINERGLPSYIYKLADSYLNDRYIIATDALGSTEKIKVNSGVPQGSILGPTLWNLLYDEVFKIKLGDNTELIGFADDLALMVKARTEEAVMEETNAALSSIKDWMEKRRLRLAPEKTEAILLSGKRTLKNIRFRLAGIDIEPKNKLRYLGIWLDKSLRFDKHIEEVATKAEKLATALGRLMPRQGGPKSNKRKTLASVANSIMLYGAPIWSKALKVEKYKNTFTRIQRQQAIRICGAYRTISTEAVLAISGEIPVERLADERARLYNASVKDRKAERNITIEEWEDNWRAAEQGKWTKELIPDLKKWLTRKHGDVNRYITQALSGHGVFNTFLYKIGKAETDKCVYCDEVDTPKHALFECVRFTDVREEYRNNTGTAITSQNLMERMLTNAEEWARCAEVLTTIMQTREKDERDRQGQQNADHAQ